MGKRGPAPRETPQLTEELRKRIATRRGYVDALLWELDHCAASTARGKVLDLVGRVLGHMEPEIPDRAPSVPRAPRAYLEWMRGRVRRSIVAHPEQTARLVIRDRELTAAIEALEPTAEPTPAELLEELVADVTGWSDAEVLAVHAEGVRRGIPGFVPR